MPLSALQKYILRQGLGGKKRSVPKERLLNFYADKSAKPKLEDQINIITKSAERLINSGLARGLGIKTAEKWFIREVILTPLVVKRARQLLGRQQELPFKIKTKNK